MYSERENTEIKLLLLLHPFQNCGKSLGGTPLNGLYWDVPLDSQGMVFILSVLNRVYNFAQVCPKSGTQFRASLS